MGTREAFPVVAPYPWSRDLLRFASSAFDMFYFSLGVRNRFPPYTCNKAHLKAALVVLRFKSSPGKFPRILFMAPEDTPVQLYLILGITVAWYI